MMSTPFDDEDYVTDRESSPVVEAVSYNLLEETALILSLIFTQHNVPHALCGGYLASHFGVADRATTDVDCIVQGGFENSLKAIRSSPYADQFEISSRIATGAKTLWYTAKGGRKIRIELLAAGEFGPVALNDQNTIVTDKGIRCLSPTEFTRTKVKAWQARRAPRDVEDVVHMLRYFQGLDPNRINPQESMDELAEEDPRVAEKWAEMMEGEEDDSSVDTASVDSRPRRSRFMGPTFQVNRAKHNVESL